MTRSIGDLDLKNSGVIAQPETKRVQVKESLVYRDGNWIKGATKLSEAGGGTHTICSGETTRPSFGFHLWWNNPQPALRKLSQIDTNKIEENQVLTGKSRRLTSESLLSQYNLLSMLILVQSNHWELCGIWKSWVTKDSRICGGLHIWEEGGRKGQLHASYHSFAIVQETDQPLIRYSAQLHSCFHKEKKKKSTSSQLTCFDIFP